MQKRRYNHFIGESPPRFAHPAESEFACLLDVNGISWGYEVHTLVITHADDGRITEAFTPDFFLPTADIYVELSVATCKNVTRKRRKIRRACERHGVVVVLHERRHVERLRARYRLPA